MQIRPITQSIYRLALVALVTLLAISSCAKPPLNLSPEATAAFNKTRVIKGLDILRDTAVDANKQIPPLVSEATMLRVVRYHQGAVRTIVATDTGWQTTVTTGLDEVNRNLPSSEQTLLKPYIALVKTILNEVTR